MNTPVPKGYTVSAFEAGNAAQQQALADFFREANNSCYCRYWHFSGDKNEWLERCASRAEDNRLELLNATAQGSGEASGVLACTEAGQVVGWLKLAPAECLSKLYAQRVYRAIRSLRDNLSGTWAIGCMLVHPAHRRHGLARALIAYVPSFARRVGAQRVDAFPWITEGERVDETLWMGPYQSYLETGFHVLHADAPYPVLRWEAVLSCMETGHPLSLDKRL